MEWLSLPALAAALLAPIDGIGAITLVAGARAGDTYEFTLTRDMAETDNRGGSARSHDRDRLVAHVVEVRADGRELEYEIPNEGTKGQEAVGDWHFPARVFKPVRGPIRLLNEAELERRVDDWLQRGGMTRAECGKLIFTWNAFRIDCDPKSAIKAIERFDLKSDDVRAGEPYSDPDGLGPTPLRKSSAFTLVAEMAVNPDAVRKGRAETDVGVAELLRKPTTFEDALRERAKDTVSGSISITFDVGPSGEVRRRTKVSRLKITRPDGRIEDQIVTETLEQRLISSGRRG